jgi:asparagine synthase (glutamine-hydrolysing)
MAGLFVLLARNGADVEQKAIDWIQEETPYDDYCSTRVLHRSARAVVGINTHGSYPYSVFQDEDFLALLDGIIYNRTEDEVLQDLQSVGRLMRRGQDFAEKIRRVVSEADGEFVACVLDKKTNQTLVFNDCLGRLSLYHSRHSRGIVLSRDLRVSLPFHRTLVPDRKTVAEVFMFGFPLGTRTAFEGISCLDPGYGLHCAPSGDEYRLFETLPLTFDIRDRFRNRPESIEFLVETFRESVRRRVGTLGARGFAALADLSGGFDTRAVMAGLSQWTQDVLYCTFGYVRDESAVAEELFETLGRPGRYVRLPAAASYDYPSAEDLLFRTDGLVNYYTTLVCHSDLFAMRAVAPPRVARFNGLAGEFIRHPYRNLSFPPSKVADALLYSAAPTDEIGRALGMSSKECRSVPQVDLDQYPESTRRSRLRRLYYFYYGRYVGHAGGERERGTFWCVSPMWSPDFARAVFTRVPLEWVGFPYFTEFMKALDPRLLSVPLYGSSTVLSSPLSVRRHQVRYYLGRNNSLVKSRPASWLAWMLRRGQGTGVPPDPLLSNYAELCVRLVKELPQEYRFMDIPRTASWPVPLRRRVLTLLLYWKTVLERVGR